MPQFDSFLNGKTDLAAAPADTDMVPVVDVSDTTEDPGGTLKRVSVTNLLASTNAAYAPGGTDVAVADGGTGASTAPAARTNLGLGNVDNTADTDKPVSVAQQAALDAKAPLDSPALTGTPTVPTAPAGTNTTQAASTAFVGTAVANATSASKWLDVGAWERVGGNAALGGATLGEPAMRVPAWTFADGGVDAIAGVVQMPHGWMEFDVELWWANIGTAVGGVSWALDYFDVAAGTLLGSSESITPQAAAQAGAQNEVVLTTVLAEQPIPTDGGLIRFEIRREGAWGLDTLTESVGLIGVLLKKG